MQIYGRPTGKCRGVGQKVLPLESEIAEMTLIQIERIKLMEVRINLK
jgi:hypothetical protein